MIAFTVQEREIKQLAKVLKGNAKQLKKQLSIAVNATAKATVSQIAKEVSKELATSQKNIKATVSIIKESKDSTSTRPSATVRQKKTSRIPLRDFGAKQNKMGVSAKVSKTAGRKTIAGAFQGARPGVMKASWRGRVFKRQGKSRLPIVQLFGASPWGVFVKRAKEKPVRMFAKNELRKQIQKRIRFLKLKASGEI